MSGFLDAVSLLTRVPTRGGADTGRAVPWFPVVGAMLGGAAAGVYAGARLVLPASLAATLAVAALVLSTGALHEDGLADIADAFGAGVERRRTLEIMKDPHHGTYGVLALVLSVGARIAAIAGLGPLAAAAALPAAQALSRGTAPMLLLLPPATSTGLAAAYATHVRRGRVILAVGGALSLGAALLGVWALPAAALAALAATALGRLSMQKIGGVTGDVLGAAQQIAEISILCLAVAAGSSLPWWRT